MLRLRKFFSFVFVLSGVIFLLTGCTIFEGYKNISMQILESQYETGLIEINTDIDSGEMGMPIVHRIFSDIENMRQLDECVLASEIADRYAVGLKYEKCYNRQIEYNKEIYDVFAYVFPNASTSMQYYESFADNPALNRECWYKWRPSPFPCYIAYNGNLALRIEGRSIETIALLLEGYAGVFDVELMSAQEIMNQALYSGQLSDAMSQYALSEYGLQAELEE